MVNKKITQLNPADLEAVELSAVEETVKDIVPVDTDSGIPKLLLLLMYSW